MIKNAPPLDAISAMAKNTLVDNLGIEITSIGENYLCGKMPVDKRTIQPFGLLHGGASVALAETLGSVGSSLIVDLNTHAPVGLSINANHIKSARQGFVKARAEIIHCGRKTHIWEIKIENEKEELVCISRLTVAIIEKR